jgi:hypothetical protein
MRKEEYVEREREKHQGRREEGRDREKELPRICVK